MVSPIENVRANTKRRRRTHRPGRFAKDLNGGGRIIQTALQKNLTIEIINNPPDSRGFACLTITTGPARSARSLAFITTN